MLRTAFPRLVALIAALGVGQAIAADGYPSKGGRDYPDNVYWGDTHVHTYLSGDAYGMGNRTTPDEAYRFAKGEAIQATGGGVAQLRRPLDFLLIADHAENLGVLRRLADGDASLLRTPDGQLWAERLTTAPALAEVLGVASLEQFHTASRMVMANKGAWNGEYAIDDAFKRTVWHEVVDTAEAHNDPGRFTTFVGFEYSSNPPMLHRNVLFAGGPQLTKQILPFSKYDSPDPADLWAYLDNYRDRVGGDVIAIPHNSNLSRGRMFSPVDFQGDALTSAYARTRAALEPVAEVTQIKGDSETHPLVSPDDEFADYETWAGGPMQKGEPDASSNAWAARSYVRPALKEGLALQARVGINPFKLGMIGSTDSHNGLAAVEEDNFWGKMGENEPGPYRAFAGSIFTASGYAAVWAQENTRDSLFAALRRREVYATTGPRITLRFFGGWDYTEEDAASPHLAAIGYDKGVPMGGDLSRGTAASRPLRFLIGAVKDPDGANLDRTQIVKGWRDVHGGLHEQVIDVAWSNGRRAGKDGKLAAIASTVDVARATYLNTVGDAQHNVLWTDPDFDPNAAAFYYVRVIAIPTPRWTAYDAAYYELKGLPATTPLVTQDRAYSSPIWYTP